MPVPEMPALHITNFAAHGPALADALAPDLPRTYPLTWPKHKQIAIAIACKVHAFAAAGEANHGPPMGCDTSVGMNGGTSSPDDDDCGPC